MGQLNQRLFALLICGVLAACGSNSSDTDGKGPSDVVPTCTTTSECPEGAICRDEVCLFPTSCDGEEDCGINRQCDLTTSTCVECLKGNDCAPGETCLAQTCRKECESGQDCGGELRCGDQGYCVECRGDHECPDDEHCTEGKCVRDACAGRSTRCADDGSVLVCSERGDGEAKLRCPNDESCGTEQGPAWCQGWICTPGQSYCDDTENIAHTCSIDGLTNAVSLNCTDTNTVCSNGICEPIVCEPFTQYCKDGDVYQCDSLGISEQVDQFCGSFEYCDEAAATCRSQICTPGALGCPGGEVGTCNALGSAYEDLTACDTSQICLAGVCEPIVCDASQRYCDGQTVRSCNATGTSSAVWDTCTSGEFCNDLGTTAYCSTDVCVAGQPACNGDVQGTCNAEGSGLEAEGTTDCALTSQVCVAGACEDVICSASERLCVDGNVHLCVNKGSTTQIYDTCTASEYCDESTATCQTQICVPSDPGCDGDVARTCNSDGSGWEAGGTDCSALSNKACDGGTCEDVICPAGGRYCSGTQVMNCNSLGTQGSVYQSCSSNYHCYESGPTTAYCRYDICTANSAICDGELATTCESDGSGPIAGGTDCTATSQACYGGSCNDIVCSGNYECVAGNYHRCVNNATSTSLYDTCSPTEYCNESLGCRAQVCEPDSFTCQGSFWVRDCNSDGSSYTSIPCSAGSEACWDGACEPIICTDGENLCLDGDYQFCDRNGTHTTLLNDCVDAQYCDPAIGCLPDVCTADQPTCNGNLVTTCNSDGSAPLPGGTDCQLSGLACHDAQCLPIVCEDGEYSCDGDLLEQCVNNGTVVETQQQCAPGRHCNATDGLCAFDFCTPGETICKDLWSVVTCGADQESYELPATECASDEVCEDGACIDAATACTIEGKTWTTPVKPNSTNATPLIGTDGESNLVIAWIGASGLETLFYRKATDSWMTVSHDEDAFTYEGFDLAVSPDGSAMIVYPRYDDDFVEELAWVKYDPATRSWSEPATFVGSGDYFTDSSFDLEADASGRFFLAYCGYEDVLGAGFTPGSGWTSLHQLSSGEYLGTCSADLTDSGRGVIGWLEEGAPHGAKWATYDFSTDSWGASQRVEGPFGYLYDLPMEIFFADESGDDILFLYGAEGDSFQELHVNRWTATGGLQTPVVLDDDFLSDLDDIRLARAADGDIYAFGGYEVLGILPDGGSTWTTETGRPARMGALMFPGNDILTGTASSITTYIEGTGWSSTSTTGRIDGALVRLPGCEAALTYRTSSGIYVSWLE